MVSAGVMGTKLPCVGSHEGAGTVVVSYNFRVFVRCQNPTINHTKRVFPHKRYTLTRNSTSNSAHQSQTLRKGIESWPAYCGIDAVIAQIVLAMKTTGITVLILQGIGASRWTELSRNI